MKDPKFAAEYNKPDLAMDIGDMITEIRLKFLQKIAKAVGTRIEPPRFVHK